MVTKIPIGPGTSKNAPASSGLHVVAARGSPNTPTSGHESANPLLNVGGGSLYGARITGPTGFEVEAYFAIFADPAARTAVLEIAPGSTPYFVPNQSLSLSERTSYGVGELIRAAVKQGAQKILVVCGEPGAIDGGAGMAQALGVGLFDVKGRQIAWGGRALTKLARIDLSGIDPAMRRLEIHCVDDHNFILCGPRGIAKLLVSRSHLPSKSDPLLALALEHYADVIHHELGIDVRMIPGGGAAGGVGASLYAFLNATLESSSPISALRSA